MKLLILLPAVAITALPHGIVAQTEQKTTATGFQILDQREVLVDGRKITYNRVAPPIFASASPSPTPASSSATPARKQTGGAEPQAAKKTVMLSISATVYDRQITLLRWWDGNGNHRAFSNVDFNWFTGTPIVETADTSYFLIIGLGNETREQAAADNIQLPALSYFSGTDAQYAVIQDGSAPPAEESLKQIDDLHVYFDANKQQLIDGGNKRQQADAERQRWLKEHPPVPKDTVVNFWPKKSSIFMGTQTGGAKQ